MSETFTPNGEYENSFNVHMEAAVKCIQTKLGAKQSSIGDSSSRKKEDNVKTTSSCNKRNSSNANVQKLKAQRELTHTKRN